ncbi:AraC family transcriptional regulator [Aurantibacter sp.]|uniref:AraC family transcriptional regulator n=1 Tax=Aurantibacter sp. TaxID=2807103 RepID=UPI0032655E46
MKVLAFEIPKSVNDSILLQVDMQKTFYNYLHQHAHIQISYIFKGNGKLLVADSIHSYKSGDVFTIGSHTPHLFQSAKNDETSHMISVFFTKDSFGQSFLKIPEMKEMQRFLSLSESSFKLLSNEKSIKQLITNLLDQKGLDKFISFLKLIKLFTLSETISLTTFIKTKQITQDEGRRIGLVFDFVMNNFQDDISLNDVASLIHLTPNAFCRFFKQHTNKTFFEFLIELRIEHSCQLAVRPENYSIADIAEMSGFSSISNFNRKFKKLKGITPSDYRSIAEFNI